MLDAAAAIQMPPLAQLPAEMVRAGYTAQRSGLDLGAPKDLDVRNLDVAGGSGPLKARLYKPQGATGTGPGLVYFHGGGFVIGNLDTHDDFLRRLCKASGVRVLSVDYRLAPEHPFPAAHDDALAATRWAFDHAAEIGFDPARIAVGGDSAGGNLSACMALELRGDLARKLAFQLLLYPATAMNQDTPSRRALATGYVLLGKPSAGAGSDLEQATRTLASLHASHGLGETLIHLCRSANVSSELSMNPDLRDRVERDLRDAEARAIGLVEKHRQAVMAVAARLIAKRHISGADVKAIVDQADGGAAGIEMLKITVELVPGGYLPARRTLASMWVSNQSDLADTSDYRIETVEGRNGLTGAPPRTAVCKVEGHDRRQSVWALLEKACAGIMRAEFRRRPSPATPTRTGAYR
eukprot:gene34429-46193_t